MEITKLKSLVLTLSSFLFVVMIASSGNTTAQAQESSVNQLLNGKLVHEKADNTKDQEIIKFVKLGKYSYKNLKIEIVEINKIQGGVEILARAWKNGQPIGFGKDGTVEMERFRFFNPPLLVTDPFGDIQAERSNRKLKEDPQKAMRQILAHTIKLVGKEGTNIIEGKIGNTTSTFFPSYDALMERYDGAGGTRQASWDNVHDSSVADNVRNTELPAGNYGGVGVATGGSGVDVEIVRGALFFDTSALPDTDIISSATISLFVTAKQNSNDDGRDYINFVLATPASTTTLAVGDFDQIGSINSPTQGATAIDIGSITTGSYNTWTLNSTGRGWISTTTTTIFGVREGHDMEDVLHTTDGFSYNDIKFYHSERNGSGTTEDPKLIVEHSAPNTAPSEPTSLQAEDQTNPVGISDPTPEFSAIYNDPDSGDSANYYSIQVSTSSSFSTIYWDSSTTTMATTTQGNRSPNLSYSGNTLASSTTYFWRIKFTDVNGAEGAWSTEESTFRLAAAEVLRVRKPSNESIQNSSTLQNDNHLILTLKPSSQYIVDGIIFVSSGSATPDLKIAFSPPSGSTLTIGYINDADRGYLLNASSSQAIAVTGGDTVIPLQVSGTVITGSSGGDVILQWAQNAANANTTTIHSGSYLRAEEI